MPTRTLFVLLPLAWIAPALCAVAEQPNVILMMTDDQGSGDFGIAGNFELYDMISDPQESQNLVAQHPDVVERLKQAYDAWFDDVSSTRPDVRAGSVISAECATRAAGRAADRGVRHRSYRSAGP